ncbi:MAG: single-stranded DNA-binding protein [Clostridiales bacterium]|jgi:single-strand DNA-binding protein|nr:single-stranded DNA-binding protein [Clostridiales bacterium]
MNKVILIGNLTRDPELTETPSGVAVCRFSIAVSRDYANADGTRETDFFNITVWRGRAENCGKYLKKGNKVAVIGSLQNRSYEDKDGIKRNVTDVVANEVEFLTPKNAQGDIDDGAPIVTAKRERPQLEAIDDNQLPF